MVAVADRTVARPRRWGARRTLVASESLRSSLLQYTIAALTLVLVAAPIVPTLYQSIIDRAIYDSGHVFTLQNYINLFTSNLFGKALINTLVLAIGSTLLGQVIGVACAILLGRTNIPMRASLMAIVLTPVFISHLVLAFGWSMIYGPTGYVTVWVQSLIGVQPWTLYSLTGMVIVAGIAQAPLAMMYCLGSTALADGNLEDAARSCGASPLRTLWTITLPLLRPSIVYGLVLNLTFGLEMLSIPLIFGEPVRINFLTSLLYTQGIGSPKPDYGLVATTAVILLVIIAALVFLQGWLLRDAKRFVTVGGKASRRRLFQLGPLRWVGFALLSVYAALFIVLPIGVLMLRSFVPILTPLVPIAGLFTTANYVDVITTEANIRAITNTIVIASVGGACATFFVALVALIVHRSNFRFRRSLEYVALFPRAVPGLIAGIGFFYAVAFVPPLGWLRNTIILIMLAYTMRYIPTAFGALSPALMQVAPDLDRSARVIGADWWKAVANIMLPLMRPAMFSCFALLFIQFFKEYSTAIFLFAPGGEVIGPALLQYWVNGDTGPLSALAVIQVLLTIMFILLSRRLLGVHLYD